MTPLIPHACRVDPPIWCGQCIWNADHDGVEGVDFYEANTVRPAGKGKPATQPAVTPASADAPVCIHRSEDKLPAAEVSALGYNPTRDHYRCGHPTLGLPVVSSCRSCGSARRAPACGPECRGYVARSPDPDD